ncbi:hypothetical protein ACMFMF_010156 [Clarireedia jacksonii]
MVMTTQTQFVYYDLKLNCSRAMERRSSLPATTCSKGHTHPPWNTTGILRIAKCETVCGFCQKETDTAAKLRKHVAIHIKNEGLNLTIAEAASGRGRLEITPSSSHDPSASSSSSSHIMSIGKEQHHQSAYSSSSISPYTNIAQRPSYSIPTPSMPTSYSTNASASLARLPISYSSTSTANSTNYRSFLTHSSPPPPPADPFSSLRSHAFRTKFEWTVISRSEGFAILDHCKSQSQTHSHSSEHFTPCYNRETLFDEEWQTHMRDVHGVYLIWPETWMKRVEVLDLEDLGGRIERANDVVMDTRGG